MTFRFLQNKYFPESGVSSYYLRGDNWNDYSYKTLFHLSLHDHLGVFHDVGSIKIGYVGQTSETSTYTAILGSSFDSLEEGGEETNKDRHCKKET